MIKRHHNKPAKVNEVIQYVLESGGIEYARNKMTQLAAEAIELLKADFPDNDARASLIELINYTVTRKK